MKDFTIKITNVPDDTYDALWNMPYLFAPIAVKGQLMHVQEKEKLDFEFDFTEIAVEDLRQDKLNSHASHLLDALARCIFVRIMQASGIPPVIKKV